MRKMFLISVFVMLISVSVTNLFGNNEVNNEVNDVERIYKELNELTILNGKVAEVEDLTFSRDVANFHLTSGKLYLLSAVNDRIVAMVFEGEGDVEIIPPTKVSKESLFSQLQSNQFYSSLNFLFMIFTDTTLVEFSKKLEFMVKKNDTEVQSELSYAKQYLLNNRNNDYSPALLQTLLNPEQNGYFYAHIRSKKSWDKPLLFEINPNETEEISLSLRKKRKSLSDNSIATICNFHRKEDYSLAESDSFGNRVLKEKLSHENKDEIYVDKYTIDATITKKMKFSANALLEFHGLHNSGRWIPLSLLNKLRINSVVSHDKEFAEVIKIDTLNFFKEDESFTLWVELPEKLTKEKNYSISIDYDGDLIYKGGSVVKIYSHDYWYPQYPTYSFKNFDLTFHYPAGYDLISVGKKVSEEKIKKMKTTRWVTSYPVNFAPLNMGKFKSEEFVNQAIPTLSLHLNKNLQNAKADVANSLAFYQAVYGKCIFDTLTVVEIPRFLSGEAYPGMINFYSDDFIKDVIFKVFTDLSICETDFAQLRAHEVAHQWWGCGVLMRNYHDKWLFEGLAEFSSIWFIQTSMKDTKKYFELLSKWRTKIVDEQAVLENNNKTEDPPWLGSRASYYITYGKGAWIFHMLRNLMLDLNTYDETKFKAMLQDFYQTYKNSTASTEEFKEIVEKHIFEDMTWFFDQWVYGNEIPKYEFDYDIVQKDDGKFYAKCTVEQSNVSDNFKSYIPIEIDFGDNRKARIRITVIGKGQDFEIPLPQKPKKINFNILDAVLCE